MTSAVATKRETTLGLAPFSLKDAPCFIESQFPVGRLSAEAYKERKAGAGQTLTALGSYWKGRKPLILVRAVVLGTLIPATNDPAKDLDIFLRLMAMDDGAFGRRFNGSAAEFARLFPKIAPKAATNLTRVWRSDLTTEDLRRRIAIITLNVPTVTHPENNTHDALEKFVRSKSAKKPSVSPVEFANSFPSAADDLTEEIETSWRWRSDVDLNQRRTVIVEAFAGLPYAERLMYVRRPEECEETELLADVWLSVNEHLGVDASSIPELIAQIGVARFGHQPKLADTFCGGGSIPFEAARMGCDVYASDLNPIACMLTWGAFNIIGASLERRAEIERVLNEIATAVDAEITRHGIEHDKHGNRAKAYLYCLETRYPKTGWMVPMLPTRVISKQRNVIASLIPDHAAKRYVIEINTGVSPEKMVEAANGTVRDGRLIHPMNPERSGVEIRTIRGDYRDADGVYRNRLRLWEKSDFVPRPDDIFQERLYAIQWITKASLGKGRQETFFAATTEDDLDLERQVETIVRSNLASWQDEGLVPDMPIEPGDKTDEPIRTRGWTYWHHLFGSRSILLLKSILELSRNRPESVIAFSNAPDFCSRLNGWGTNATRESPTNVFQNQALNPNFSWGFYATTNIIDIYLKAEGIHYPINSHTVVEAIPASQYSTNADMLVTDPPYADAINYHEIPEFFIAWLRNNPPPPFDQWAWDSRRSLAIKGKDETFRRDMVTAYAAMVRHMPDSGIQVVMFTHQDAGVWADLGAILWAAGLRVTGAWNIVTEAETALKAGNYVQGTVCLVLRKRLREANARRMEIEAEIEAAVAQQLERLTALSETWTAETLYTDGDLTLAAYAAALQVVTSYSTIDRQPLDRDLYRKLAKNERTMIRDLVEYAAQVANGLLVPGGFPRDAWRDLGPSDRFYVRMLDMEAKGTTKVADFQNFAKSFAYGDYATVMASTTANAASLAGAADLKGRMLDGEGFAKTQLRQVLFAIWKTLDGSEREPEAWRDDSQD